MNPQEQFQNRITDAVNKAAANGVHPALIYMVLGGVQDDVLNSVRKANRAAAESSPSAPAPDSQPSTLNPQPPNNVIPLPESDTPA